MGMRIFLPRAAKEKACKLGEAEVGGIETGMLARQDECRCNSTGCKSACDRLEFDGFGPGPNNQPDIGETQPSP
jgi:hypothetical protein